MAQIDAQGYISYFFPKFHPKVLRLSRTASGLLLISNLLVILLAACSPTNQTEFSSAFELNSFLKNHIQELPSQMVRFQILDSNGEPVPYDILRFESVEGVA